MRDGDRVLNRNPTSGFRKAALLNPLAVILLAVLLVAGCGALPSLAPVTISHPVWMADGWVYYLREVSSDGFELWRQRGSQGAAKRVLGRQAITSICDGAQLSFLFRATEQEVGIAAACAGATRMELTAYSPDRTTFRQLASTSFLSGVTLAPGTAMGYVELPTDCGIAISPIRDGVVGDFAGPVRVAGSSWKLSGASPPDCGSVGWVRSPALGPDGSLYFLTAPDSIGKLPVTNPNALDEFHWYLSSWDGKTPAARVVATLPGVADLTVSPDGRSVIAAVSTPDVGGIWMIDTATGKKEKIVKAGQAYHPSLSPDSSRYVFVEELDHLRFGSLPTRPGSGS